MKKIVTFSWQDGEVVDYTWTRVKTNKNYLKVTEKHYFCDYQFLQFCILQLRGAKLEDTGIFYCRGVNGFGSVRVRVELIVTGESRFLGLFFLMINLFQTRPVRT